MKELTNKAIPLLIATSKKKPAKIFPIHRNDNEPFSQPSTLKRFDKLCINTSDGSIIVDISEIIRLESASNYTYLYTQDANKYVISKTMKVLIALLPAEKFIRCHKSHFVSLNEISAFKKSSLTLKNNIEIPIARQRYHEVVKAINDICYSI